MLQFFISIFALCTLHEHTSTATKYDNSDFRKAADPAAFWSLRVEAASKLGFTDRAKLRHLLSRQLPGDYDVKTLDAVCVLGVVEDAGTAKFLRTLQDTPIEIPGKINTAIISSIDDIEARLAKETIK